MATYNTRFGAYKAGKRKLGWRTKLHISQIPTYKGKRWVFERY